MGILPGFEKALKPKSIAIVGASAKDDISSYIAPAGLSFLKSLMDFGYEGKIYPVNPGAKEIMGIPSYNSLLSLPEIPDLVIISVPADKVKDVLHDAIGKGVKNVQIYTAGFKEAGYPELEEEIKDIALGKLNLLGPNCMGICYVPSSKISLWPGLVKEAGRVAFITQSGGHALQFIQYAQGMGIRFSKVISYGNATIIEAPDLLEVLEDDEETDVICLYIEGVRDGRKLFEVSRRLSRKKPLIVWKGGSTEYGKRAAFSHTGSLAGEDRVWDAFFKQTGVIRAYGIDELADILIALDLPRMRGRRVGIILNGGGYSVLAADICGREGLEVPALTDETQRRLREFIPPAGTSIKNPLDVETVFRKPELLEKTLALVEDDPNIDIIFFALHLDLLAERRKEQIDEFSEFLKDFAKRTEKPIAITLDTWGGNPYVVSRRASLSRELPSYKIGVFRSIGRGARAIARVIEYYERLTLS